MSNPYRDKLLGIGYLSKGLTKPKVVEGRRPDGIRIKATTDELNNTVTEHATKEDRVDVHLRPKITAAQVAFVNKEN